ncbi:MAG: hypothetical protein M5U01_43005 [Ardenticatenaceae bacterium]|nr:hypothetical protein [Ardenticatenaceae bacterium]
MCRSSFSVQHLAFRMKRLWLLLALLAGFGLSAAVEAQTPANRVGLVVRQGDGRVLTACVEFNEPTISGTEVLLRAGLPATIDVQRGGTICSINGEGCQFPAQNCFCQCETLGAACTYWAYHHLEDNHWVYSQIGASGYQVQPGTVEGWAWGKGRGQGGHAAGLHLRSALCKRAVPGDAGSGAESRESDARSGAPSPNPEPTATHPAAATAAASVESGASPSPQPLATGAPSPTAAPTELAALAVPGPPPAAQPAGQIPARAGRGVPTGYLAFGAIALLLLAGIAWNRQRSRR